MMTDVELNKVTIAYQHLRDRFSHDQIATLSTMLYRLDQNLATKEILGREKAKLDSYEKRTAWKSETTSVKPAHTTALAMTTTPTIQNKTVSSRPSKIKLMSGNGKSVVDPSMEEL